MGYYSDLMGYLYITIFNILYIYIYSYVYICIYYDDRCTYIYIHIYICIFIIFTSLSYNKLAGFVPCLGKTEGQFLSKLGLTESTIKMV